jgi:hypothetical protein
VYSLAFWASLIALKVVAAAKPPSNTRWEASEVGVECSANAGSADFGQLAGATLSDTTSPV